MRSNEAGPSGVATGPAPKIVSKFAESYPVPNDPQWQSKALGAERRLIAAGWTWASQLACEAEKYGLHFDHFGDRLCGVVCGFLRACGEDGRKPDLVTAEAVLTSFVVPRDPGELAAIIDGAVSAAPHGSEFADLVGDVLAGTEQRSARELRELTRDTLKITLHAIGCPKCQACATGYRPSNRPGLRGRAVA